MKNSALKKSSFTLPVPEIELVSRLKKKLHLKSNTAVVRRALLELQAKVERVTLRQKFKEASQMVRKVNRKEMQELDLLSDEGI
jgi:hypothetical protein